LFEILKHFKNSKMKFFWFSYHKKAKKIKKIIELQILHQRLVLNGQPECMLHRFSTLNQ